MPFIDRVSRCGRNSCPAASRLIHHERGKNAGMAQPGQDAGLAAARSHHARTVAPGRNVSRALVIA